jgi:hypothetical protein
MLLRPGEHRLMRFDEISSQIHVKSRDELLEEKLSRRLAASEGEVNERNYRFTSFLALARNLIQQYPSTSPSTSNGTNYQCRVEWSGVEANEFADGELIGF